MNQIKKAIEQCLEELDKTGNNINKRHELIELMQAYEALEFIAVDEYTLKMTN